MWQGGMNWMHQHVVVHSVLHVAAEFTGGGEKEENKKKTDIVFHVTCFCIWVDAGKNRLGVCLGPFEWVLFYLNFSTI